MKALILIPARYQSTRFPGKPLEKINGKTMVYRVLENCLATGYDCAVVTDDSRIEDHVSHASCELSSGSNRAQVCRVNDNVSTGSERVYLAYQRFFKDKGYDYIVNVQGDEPLLKSSLICELVGSHKLLDYDILTCVKKRNSNEPDFKNPNVVKAIYSEKSQKCHYFTRSEAPYSNKGNSSWFQHIGIYSYKVQALESFNQASRSSLEELEQLEQLRALENDLIIGAIQTDLVLHGVDTPSDIKKIERLIKYEKK